MGCALKELYYEKALPLHRFFHQLCQLEPFASLL